MKAKAGAAAEKTAADAEKAGGTFSAAGVRKSLGIHMAFTFDKNLPYTSGMVASMCPSDNVLLDL